ncbi:putative serine protease 47 [Saimiri boliviensis]|uniref:putative serine protease 47 n=1 Tax=Saimiri boliviensis TaxID=27679 RepID=UPI003D77EB25
MRVGATRTGAQPGHLLWCLLLLLLLLLLLSPEAASASQSHATSPSQAPGEARESPGVQEGQEPVVRTQGPFEAEGVGPSGPRGGDGWAQGAFERAPGPQGQGVEVSARPGGVSSRQGDLGELRPEAVDGGVSTVCGKPQVVGKIYGGRDAAAGQWPWQASLLYRGSHLCGAVLINSRWLLSTAHCFLNKSQALENYQVLLGNTQLYHETQHTQKKSVHRIITHPDFEKLHTFGSDIAMLQLHPPVNFTSYVVPVCLPSRDMQLPSNVSCWITGWGMLTEDREGPLPTAVPSRLQAVCCPGCRGQRVGPCVDRFRSTIVCSEGQLRSLTPRDFYLGDSGGPLVCYLPSAWVLVGLASWGLDCRHPAYPSIFTRVSYFANWIDEIMRLTPLPDPAVAPHTRPPPKPLRAAGLPGPCTALVPPQTWFLMPLTLRAPWQTL